MQLSMCHVTLGLVAMLAVVCKVCGSDSGTHLQGEVRKRIFCNFYGCGSKRSGNKMADLSPMDANMADLDLSSENAPGLGRSDDFDMATQEAAFAASQKILRAATLWEALKERVQQERSGAQRVFKRNSS